MANNKKKPTMKLIIKDILGVGRWHWLVNEDICSICRTPFEMTCPNCRFAGDDCPLMRGYCTHNFHKHCIQKWLTTEFSNNQCPICRQVWLIIP